MRGVRMQLHWHENPLYRFASRPGSRDRSRCPRNVARLADYGWSFDLQVFAPQMAGAAELAAACPKVTFVLQHAGMLEDLSRPGWAWRAGMMRLARAAEHRLENLGARHLHPSQRPGAYRGVTRETVGDLRRGALPVRLELSDREALDHLSRAGRRPSRRRAPLPEADGRDPARYRDALYRLA